MLLPSGLLRNDASAFPLGPRSTDLPFPVVTPLRWRFGSEDEVLHEVNREKLLLIWHSIVSVSLWFKTNSDLRSLTTENTELRHRARGEKDGLL